MRRIAGFVAMLLWAGAALAADPSSLAGRKAQAAKEQHQLRQRIQAIQEKIDRQESSRDDAADDLKASESAISTINRRLAELAEQADRLNDDLRDIAGKTASQRTELRRRQAELADQLRAEYASGLSPWTALLSGDDPQEIGRDLSYLGYVSKARAETVHAIQRTIDELSDLRRQSQDKADEVEQVKGQVARQKAELQKQKKERERVLARIDERLKKQRAQADRLQRNEKHLGGLIASLDKAIAAQAEARRRAEEKRKAEAARKARQQAEEREKAAQREAAQRRQAAQEREEAEQRRRAQDEARKKAPRREPSERRAPPGGFHGLKKGMPYPVQGDVQGRFGSSRPDGGIWRGVVLRAPAGTPVHVIADGRVVYANWLTGFGNIMIVDHGNNYLSIYAYNQSLLKRVGDIVRQGDTIATVGSTGGQVEAGLYFEIRHKGVPINPLLWLAR